MKMKDYFGLEMETCEERLQIRLAARIAYRQGGFPDEAMQLMEGIEDEHLTSHVLNRVLLPANDMARSITSVTIALFQDHNSALRESIEHCRNHSYENEEAYFKALGADSGIPGLYSLYLALLCGQTIPFVHSKSCKTIGLPDDQGNYAYIDGRAALRRAAIAAQIAVYMRFPNPEEVMEMDIRFREKSDSGFSA